MQLTLSNVLPTYFDASKKEVSELWGKNFVFKNGDFVKIVAPSGTGKTSLIHFLYGLRKDYHGELKFDQLNLKTATHQDVSLLRSNHVSVVLQDMRLFPEQTLLQNLEIKRQLHPYHESDKIIEMAHRLGIQDRLHVLAKTCSYGEQQRAVIIRALMQPFDFLLMDEPFSHLDEANAQKAMKLILEETEKRKAGIIFAELERIDFFPATHLFHL